MSESVSVYYEVMKLVSEAAYFIFDSDGTPDASSYSIVLLLMREV